MRARACTKYLDWLFFGIPVALSRMAQQPCVLDTSCLSLAIHTGKHQKHPQTKEETPGLIDFGGKRE